MLSCAAAIHPWGDQMKAKIGLFCNVPVSHVLENLNCDVLYEVPLMLEEEHLADVACECLGLDSPKPGS